MSTLYQLAESREAIDRALEESEGELSPAMETALDALEGEIEAKIQNVALYIREELGEAEAAMTEAIRLKALAAARTTRAESLKGYLQGQMVRLGKTKVKGTLATVALRDNNPAVIVTATPATLREWATEAPDFVRVTPEVLAPDKGALLEAFKAGTLPERIAPFVVISRTQSLRIS